MPDIGNTLREARLKRGLSIADVENAIKVRRRYLEALEENDFEVLPDSTVVKGFLRSYSTFLKVDPEGMLAEYRSAYEPQREEIGSSLRTEMAQQQRTRTTAERKKKRVRRTQRGYVTAALVAVVIIVVIAYFSARGDGKGGAVLGAGNLPTTVSTVVSTTVSIDTTTTSAVDGTTTSTSETVPSTTGENITMVLSVKEGDCWLVVREDNENGAELYAGVLSGGGQQSFNSAKRYWLRVGLPEALTISVNGASHVVGGDFGEFLVTETGPEREQTSSTTTTE